MSNKITLQNASLLRVVAAIAASSDGLLLEEIVAQTGLSTSYVKNILTTGRRAKILGFVQIGNNPAVWHATSSGQDKTRLEADQQAALPEFRGRVQDVAEFVRQNPGVDRVRVAEVLGIHVRSAYPLVREAIAHGLIVRVTGKYGRGLLHPPDQADDAAKEEAEKKAERERNSRQRRYERSKIAWSRPVDEINAEDEKPFVHRRAAPSDQLPFCCVAVASVWQWRGGR